MRLLKSLNAKGFTLTNKITFGDIGLGNGIKATGHFTEI